MPVFICFGRRSHEILHHSSLQDHHRRKAGARWLLGCETVCIGMRVVLNEKHRPVVTLLTSHWLTMAGGLLASVAACSWLLTLPSQVRGHAANPYIGILTFVVLPIAFATGLVLMPVGMWLSRRAIQRGAKDLLTTQAARRRLVGFLAVATFLNVVIMSQLSYSAVMYME